MEKKDVQNENKTVEVTTAEKLPEETPAVKPNLVTRGVNAVKRTIVKVRRSKTGRVVLTVLELGGVGFAGYKWGFKKGVESAAPAEVYINGGTVENVNDIPVDEEPAEEEINEEHE